MGSKSQKQNRERTSSPSTRGRNLAWGALAGVTTVGVLALILLLPAGGAVASPIEFTDVEEQTGQFMEYYRSIELNPEQEAIKREALSELPAPCCSDRSAYTCCCECNMAKSWWGLSHHLIAEEGLGADEVRAAVSGWFEFINPNGFSGDACYRGGCFRPFHSNGCGGMDGEQVVY